MSQAFHLAGWPVPRRFFAGSEDSARVSRNLLVTWADVAVSRTNWSDVSTALVSRWSTCFDLIESRKLLLGLRLGSQRRLVDNPGLLFEVHFLVVPNDLFVHYEGSLKYPLLGQELGRAHSSVASASGYARLLCEGFEALIGLVLQSFLFPSMTHGRLNRWFANLGGAVYRSRLSIKLSFAKEILRSSLSM